MKSHSFFYMLLVGVLLTQLLLLGQFQCSVHDTDLETSVSDIEFGDSPLSGSRVSVSPSNNEEIKSSHSDLDDELADLESGEDSIKYRPARKTSSPRTFLTSYIPRSKNIATLNRREGLLAKIFNRVPSNNYYNFLVGSTIGFIIFISVVLYFSFSLLPPFGTILSGNSVTLTLFSAFLAYGIHMFFRRYIKSFNYYPTDIFNEPSEYPLAEELADHVVDFVLDPLEGSPTIADPPKDFEFKYTLTAKKRSDTVKEKKLLIEKVKRSFDDIIKQPIFGIENNRISIYIDKDTNEILDLTTIQDCLGSSLWDRLTNLIRTVDFFKVEDLMRVTREFEVCLNNLKKLINYLKHKGFNYYQSESPNAQSLDLMFWEVMFFLTSILKYVNLNISEIEMFVESSKSNQSTSIKQLLVLLGNVHIELCQLKTLLGSEMKLLMNYYKADRESLSDSV